MHRMAKQPPADSTGTDPNMLIPGELQNCPQDWGGAGKYGGIADLQGPGGQRKGNQTTSASPQALPDPRPFRSLTKGR